MGTKGLNLTALQAVKGEFHSAEGFSEAASALGWEARFRQLDSGPGISRFDALASPAVTVMRVDFDNRMHQQALAGSNLTTFGILACPQAPGKIGHRILESESLLHIDPVHGLDAVIERDFSGYIISIDNGRLSQLAQLLEFPDPGAAESEPGTERQPDATAIALLRGLLDDVMQAGHSAEPDQTLATALNDELPTQLLQSWFSSSAPSTGSPSSRTRVRNRALEFIAANPSEPFTVEQLCRASASSFSTLERAFQEYFGVSPKSYLTLSRLSGVRRALVCEKSQRSITEIAHQWGFWHMGKFAADYRKAFGELPSATRQAV